MKKFDFKWFSSLINELMRRDAKAICFTCKDNGKAKISFYCKQHFNKAHVIKIEINHTKHVLKIKSEIVNKCGELEKHGCSIYNFDTNVYRNLFLNELITTCVIDLNRI